MQEEVTQKTVTFCIRTTKVTADLLKKVLAAYLRHQKQKSVEKKAKKNQPKQGKVTVDELRERINEIEKGKPVYLICQSGLRSYIASRILEGNGYETYNFSGGFRFYDAVVNDRALIERAYACGMDY